MKKLVVETEYVAWSVYRSMTLDFENEIGQGTGYGTSDPVGVLPQQFVFWQLQLWGL